MNKAVLLRGSLVSTVMAVAMKHAGWVDSGQAMLSCAFVLAWLWAAHTGQQRDAIKSPNAKPSGLSAETRW